MRTPNYKKPEPTADDYEYAHKLHREGYQQQSRKYRRVAKLGRITFIDSTVLTLTPEAFEAFRHLAPAYDAIATIRFWQQNSQRAEDVETGRRFYLDRGHRATESELRNFADGMAFFRAHPNMSLCGVTPQNGYADITIGDWSIRIPIDATDTADDIETKIKTALGG